ncbi:hypothetical protein [Paucisalibacillus sp. EB02]|uniref:hypothetical protein n=1 Tax=Paucisalibacillus sp. EB02 TaxID=1347087 RepID=UPI0004B03DE4|nr:hypothetical protein [Paucisalibacillus sp. EB02]
MDKELKDLQSQFNQIPTSFTNQDKQAIRDKIDRLQSKKRLNRVSIYPKLLTGFAVVVAVLIFVVTINQSPDIFMSSNDSSSDAEMNQEFSMHEEKAANDSDTSNALNSDAAGSEESLGLNIFNPETVQSEMILPVIDVRQNGDETIITFKGERLTGSLIDEQPLTFIPDTDSWKRIPIAEGDINKDIPVYFADEEYVRSTLGFKGTTNDMTITPYALEYHYSSEGSSIRLIMEEYNRIDGEVTNSYSETIALSDELMQIFNEYKTSFDDSLLKGLSAFDVFKIYHYTNSLNDLDTQYALYYKKDSFPYPDKESFIAEFKSNYTIDQAEAHYEEMLQIQQFDELKLSDNEVLIRYTTQDETGGHDMGFRLYLDEELDVYKIAWMPIQ